MRIGGFSFLTRTNERFGLVMAAWHSPHSMTWRWALYFRLAPNWRLWPILHWYRSNTGFECWARLPLLGTVDFKQQEPMWYRDMYVKLRTRVDQEDGMLWLPDNHPEKIHRKVPVPTPNAPTSPTVQ